MSTGRQVKDTALANGLQLVEGIYVALPDPQRAFEDRDEAILIVEVRPAHLIGRKLHPDEVGTGLRRVAEDIRRAFQRDFLDLHDGPRSVDERRSVGGFRRRRGRRRRTHAGRLRKHGGAEHHAEHGGADRV